MIELYQGDCLEKMVEVPDHTVDMIFTDLPYGTTQYHMEVVNGNFAMKFVRPLVRPFATKEAVLTFLRILKS